MNKDSILYKVVLLGVLCGICGLLLGAVNAVTAPVIEAQALAAEKENLEKIYPGATFTQVAEFEDESGLIESIFVAEGKGTVYKIKNIGYNSNGFTFMVAFNEDGTVGGFTDVEQSETSGIGSRCFDDEYVSQITALTSTDEAPLLSGATLTSTAIRDGIAAAQAHFNNNAGIEYTPSETSESSAEETAAEPAAVSLGSADYSQNEATAELVSSEGNTAVYHTTAKGFHVISGQGEELNEADITVDTDSMKVVSIVISTFGDTVGVGDQATSDSALSRFEGVTLDDAVDTVASATYTDDSVKAMVQAALNAAAGN